ncbi:MAG: MFS transporter, partial [Dehalococcoidia bacterium]
VGVVIAAYGLPQLLLRIPIGLYYDAITRRMPIIMLSIVIAVGSALLLTVANSAVTLFLARAMAGVASAGWVAFTMLFTAYYPPEHSARAIGLINAVNQAAMVAATGSGGVLADAFGYRAVFLIAAGLAALGLLAMSFAHEPAAVSRPRTVGSLRAVATSPLLIASSAMAVLMMYVTYASIFGFIPTYGASIGASDSQLGAITMLTLAASAVSAFVSVRVAERIGYTMALSLAAVLMAGSLLLVPTTTTPEALALVQIASGLGRGSLLALLMALSIQSAPSAVRATAMGVFQAMYAIGSLVGPIVSGAVADRLGLDAVFQLSVIPALAIVVVARHRVVRRSGSGQGVLDSPHVQS